MGAELDGHYLLPDDAGRRDHPRSQVWPDNVDDAWALHRAHVHAGRFRLLTGADPRRFLPVPGWPELAADLDRELGFVVRHPGHPAFGVLNLARLLLSWTGRDVVVSKYRSALWALDVLDPHWHPPVRAALRDYRNQPRAGDAELLADALPPFLEFGTSEIARLRG